MRLPGWAALALLLSACDLSAPGAPGLDNPYDGAAQGGARILPTPGSPRVERSTPTSVTLVWDDPSRFEAGTYVERGHNGEWARVATLGPDVTTYTDTTLYATTPVSYRVRLFSASVTGEASPQRTVRWTGQSTLLVANGNIRRFWVLDQGILVLGATLQLYSHTGTLLRSFGGSIPGEAKVALNLAGSRAAVLSPQHESSLVQTYDVSTGSLLTTVVSPLTVPTFTEIGFVDDETVVAHGVVNVIGPGDFDIISSTEQAFAWNAATGASTALPLRTRSGQTLIQVASQLGLVVARNAVAYPPSLSAYNPRTNALVWQISVPSLIENSLPSALFSPDGALFATSDPVDPLYLYDAATGQIKESHRPTLFVPTAAGRTFVTGSYLNVTAFSHDNRLLALNGLYLYDRVARKTLRFFDAPVWYTTSPMAFSRDADALLIASGNSLKQYEVSGGWRAD